MNANRTDEFNTIPVGRAVLRQITPAVASQLVTIVYNLADTYFVGLLNQPVQTAAITVATPVFVLMTAISNLFGVGGASALSRSLGRRDHDAARQICAISFWWGLVTAVCFCVLFGCITGPVLRLCGADSETMPMALAYARWTVIIGGVGTILSALLANLIRAEGRSGAAGAGLMLGGILNILLDPIFVLPRFLGLGAEGAAIATALSNAVATVFFLVYLYRIRHGSVLSLQPRLKRLAELVQEDARLADIGTDHGYIPVHLLQTGRITSAIATNIGAEPLQHARRTAAEYGLSECMDFRLCDGLAGITPEEADCILIAGMGGETIISILEGAVWLRGGEHRLLLQPQSRQELLRTWLTEHGFCILREHLVLDKGTIYNILMVEAGESARLSEVERVGGVGLEDDPLYGDYLDWQMKKLQQTVSGLRRSRDAAAPAKAAELEELIRRLENRKGEWEHGKGTGD